MSGERSALAPSPPAAASFEGSKVRPRHLARQALIYVRQSSLGQVQRHPESARRQYGLAQRAQRLGWPVEQIRVIDDDQGQSGAGGPSAERREGFARLVSAVGLGEVGFVLALEVSRLARNSAEWYRLLELCALAGTLIGDEDAIYDPRAFNDRLLLGLRGTISEVELHCIQARLHGARLSKAQRGELALRLPVGYLRGQDGRVELDPDQAVQGALGTIFAEFERLGSASAVLRFFCDHGLKIPRRHWSGTRPDPIVWVKPNYQAIYLILANPFYAGAYAYGRRRQEDETPLGRGGPRRRYALEEAGVLLRDHHPGYLPWERYLAQRETLRDNTRRFPASRGAAREGSGLLQGIVSCGRCGRRMRPHYGSPSPIYVCASAKQRYGEPFCQSLTMAHVDRAVGEAFLAIVRPAEVEAALALSEELERERALVERQWQLRLERARYEAERARRQYDQCEPENRLVARELETRWNERLRELAVLDEEYRRQQQRGLSPLSEEEKAILRRLVGDVPALWQAAATTPEERKRLLRCLVREVLLRRDDGPKRQGGITGVRIGWRSGSWTDLEVRRPSSSEHLRTPAEALARLHALAQQMSDECVADRLNAEGLRTRSGLAWTAERVQQIRRAHDIPTACPVLPKGIEARADGLVPLGVAATQLGVARSLLRYWQRWGFLHAEQARSGSPLWVRLTEADLARLDGTLAARGHGRWRLREAERVLGLSREEIWERARRGELIAYRARVGEHWEWRLSPPANRSSQIPTAATSTS